jgi:Polyketide cyclase / dehydrase and lipid transport
VDPINASVTIDRPRDEVFEYLVDIANHPEFSDHYLKDWRLTRIDSVGRGAGARFRTDAPFNRFGWGDITFVEVERPHRIVALGRGGKYNRIKTTSIWTLDVAPGGGTDIELMVESEPALPTDRLVEALSGRRAWFRRKTRKALRRLQSILEENEDRGARATVAGL